MRKLVGGKHEKEFCPKSHNPYNTLPAGEGAYSDHIFTTLYMIEEHENTIDIKDIATAIKAHYGEDDSPYQIALAKRPPGEGVPKKPVEGPWITKCVLKALENIKADKIPSGSEECEDDDGFFFGLPAFLGTLDWHDGCDVAQMMTPRKAKAMATIMTQFKIILNNLNDLPHPINATTYDEDILKFYPELALEIKDLVAECKQKISISKLVKKHGMACKVPDVFLSSMVVLLKTEDFRTAVRKNILAAGDVCARAVFIGAVYGAKLGMDAIPHEWIYKVQDIDLILEHSLTVFKNEVKNDHTGHEHEQGPQAYKEGPKESYKDEAAEKGPKAYKDEAPKESYNAEVSEKGPKAYKGDEPEEEVTEPGKYKEEERGPKAYKGEEPEEEVNQPEEYKEKGKGPRPYRKEEHGYDI